jgi:hypothetical protein
MKSNRYHTQQKEQEMMALWDLLLMEKAKCINTIG